MDAKRAVTLVRIQETEGVEKAPSVRLAESREIIEEDVRKLECLVAITRGGVHVSGLVALHPLKIRLGQLVGFPCANLSTSLFDTRDVLRGVCPGVRV